MPEDYIIPIILDKKFYLNNNIKNKHPGKININAAQYNQIQTSLNIFGFNDIESGYIETLFERGYINKICGIENKLIELKNLGFDLDFSTILLLCVNELSQISKSIAKYQSLTGKLGELKELGFKFNGESFSNILHLSENQIDRIIKYKEHFLFLKSFGVEFDLANWEYFNFDEELVNKLFSLGEKLKLAKKIGLKISLKNLCVIKNNQKSSKEFEKTKAGILEKLQAVLTQENQNIQDEVGIINNSYKNYIYEINNISTFSTKKEKPEKEFIFSFIDDSNYFNPAFLDTLDESVFDKALENIEILGVIFSYLRITNIDIKDFLDLSCYFEKPICLVQALSAGLRIDLEILKRYKKQMMKFENPDFAKRLELLISVGIDVSLDNADVIENISEDDLIKIEKNKTHIMVLTDYEPPTEGLQVARMRNGIRMTGKKEEIEVICSGNLEELVETHKNASKEEKTNSIFNTGNLAFILNITSQNPGSLTKFISTYFKYNFSSGIIDALLKEQLIDNLDNFLKNFSENGLNGISNYLNGFIILSEVFGFKISEETRKQTYDFNIHSLLGGNVPKNITSLNEMFEHLEKTGFHEGKITKDNIEEIGALINFDFNNNELETIKGLEKIKSGNNIDIYKKIVRALGEYMYSNNITNNSNFSNLCLIFGKIFNSKFLIHYFLKIIDKYIKYLFEYLLSKKVRLQDIERAYNNYDNLFTLNIDNEYYRFCLDFAIQTDNYDYLAQNIETVKYLQDNGFMQKLISGLGEIQDEGKIYEKFFHIFTEIKDIKNNKTILDIPDILNILKEILDFTGGYLTVSIVKGYIEGGKSLEELLEESIEAKKEVLSPNPITHLNLATYETIFLAYRPTGFTIDTIKKNIENGNISDMSHHLEGIHYNPEGYQMEFFDRSYSLEGEQDITVVNGIHNLLKGKAPEENICTSMNLKLFFSTATNIFSTINGETQINDGIHALIAYIYAPNKDSRIQSYLGNFDGDDFSYERLSELREIFGIVTKDSFGLIIGLEIDSLSLEEKEKLWENIGKLKDRNVKAKYDELNAKDIKITEKLIEVFLWRLLEYAKTIRKYLTSEMKKFSEVKGKQTQVKAVLSKNIGSFFAKAGAGLCTSENYEMWKEQRHIHLNLVDENRQEIIGNVMLYFEPGRNYLVARGFNPRTDIETTYDVNHMVDEMIKVVKEIAVQNGYVDENGEALVFIPPQDGTHPVSNREKVRKRMKYIVGKVGEEIHDTKFSANKEGVWVFNTLHKI